MTTRNLSMREPTSILRLFCPSLTSDSSQPEDVCLLNYPRDSLLSPHLSVEVFDEILVQMALEGRDARHQLFVAALDGGRTGKG